MLEYFRQSKQEEITQLRLLLEQGKLSSVFQGRRPGFLDALRLGAQKKGLGVIAEYKRASPSRGDISLDLSPEEVAQAYHENGADAMSVLTEESRFKGSMQFLEQIHAKKISGFPLLRKDFILDPLQIVATAQTSASALLLIVKLTPASGMLRLLREQAEAFGLDAVVEIFDKDDLAIARDSGARIIQVNARNLNDFSVDRSGVLALAQAERSRMEEREFWIAASALEDPEHLRMAADAGFDAVLVGTQLMKQANPGLALAELCGPLQREQK